MKELDADEQKYFERLRMKEQLAKRSSFLDALKAVWEFTIGDFLRISSILKEISNYYYIGRIIRKNKDTKNWMKFNLRRGYFNVIYTVRNLPPEVFAGEQIYWKAYVIENLKPLNDYLASLNLHEIVRLDLKDKVNQNSGSYAYLIKYVPLFRDLSLWWVLKWSGIFTGIAVLQHKYGIFNHLWHMMMWMVSYIQK